MYAILGSTLAQVKPVNEFGNNRGFTAVKPRILGESGVLMAFAKQLNKLLVDRAPVGCE